MKSWVTKHPKYAENFNITYNSLNRFVEDPILHHGLIKASLIKAYHTTKYQLEQLGATTPEENLHWMLKFVRALRCRDVRALYRCRSACKHIKDNSTIFEGLISATTSDLNNIHSLIARLTNELGEQEIDSIRESALSEADKAAMIKKVDMRLSLWRSSMKRLFFNGILDDQGHPVDGRDHAAAHVINHWSKVLEEKPTVNEDMQKLIDIAKVADLSSVSFPSDFELDEYLGKLVDSGAVLTESSTLRGVLPALLVCVL